MIPIGQASTAGNLTFKSTATIVAKEGISMGAGAGAQKITTDVTGNDTAGMVAGMVASGVTAKGLNGIEAETNKLAKPKFGEGGDGGDAVLNDANMDLAVKGSSNSSVASVSEPPFRLQRKLEMVSMKCLPGQMKVLKQTHLLPLISPVMVKQTKSKL